MKLLSLNFNETSFSFKNEILAGITVAMTMIPESLSFAILAGLSPINGLYAAFIMGIITAFFGGRPAMVSGGAGATIITMIALIKGHGVEYLFAAVLLAGFFQIIVGVFKFGKFIKLVPESVMYGFVNGLAVVIFSSQLAQFKTENNWLTGTALLSMIVLVAATIGIIYIIPKITKKIPSSLIAIIVITIICISFQIETKTVKDIASISGDFPKFHFPLVPFTLKTLEIILPFSIIMASVGLIESLLTMNVVDDLTNSNGNPNKECVAQGGANILNGLFTGMGGCAMIAQSVVNVNAGGRHRLSSIVGALTILCVILFASSMVEIIPMAALVGVMMVVSITTFNWKSIRIYKEMPLMDFITMLTVALITIFFHNLALAVLIGVTLSALSFSWESAKRIRAKKYIDSAGNKHYEIYGPLFFGSTSKFISKFNVDNDSSIVFIHFKESRIVDISAIDTLSKLSTKYACQNKKVILVELSEESKRRLLRAKSVTNINVG